MDRGSPPTDDLRRLRRVCTTHFGAGRNVIRQGFTPTAPVVLWDATAVRLVR